MRKLIALATMAAMCCGSVYAAEDDCCGVSYYDSYGTTGLSPSIAVGVIAAAAVVAVLVNGSGQGDVSSHIHCHASE